MVVVSRLLKGGDGNLSCNMKMHYQGKEKGKIEGRKCQNPTTIEKDLDTNAIHSYLPMGGCNGKMQSIYLMQCHV